MLATQDAYNALGKFVCEILKNITFLMYIYQLVLIFHKVITHLIGKIKLNLLVLI